MDKVKLELGFFDELNKKFKITIDNPKEDLSREDVETAMTSLLTYNIFTSKGMELVKLDVAKIVTTSIQEMEF